MTDESLMPFGKYRGEKMANVPASYLMWAWDNKIVSVHKWPKVWIYIRENLDAIKSELSNAGR